MVKISSNFFKELRAIVQQKNIEVKIIPEVISG
jgi:hypothetical protein